MTKSEDKAIFDRANFLRDLLQEFNAKLSSFGPGVTALCERPEPLTFSEVEWAFLEPLLVELRELRKLKSLMNASHESPER